MVKRTINFQIGDQFTLHDLKTISSRKYARQIGWHIRMIDEGCSTSWSLATIVKDLTKYVKMCAAIDVDTDNICEVYKVDEDYNYLHVYLQCINPDIKSYIHRRISERRYESLEYEAEREKEGGYVDKDGIYVYTPDEIAYREHMSEFHGWNPR